MGENIIKDGIIMMHPIRWSILNTLKLSDSEMYIDEIATTIGQERRLVAFHLSLLEERGFLASEFKTIQEPHSKGKAGRFFKLTDKFDNLRPQLAHLIEGNK
jgi:predicted ArsR family transcriptional regulator